MGERESGWNFGIWRSGEIDTCIKKKRILIEARKGVF